MINTEILDMTASTAGIERAGQIIRDGGLVAFPTETVYGLGGSATDPDAAKKIYAAKGRPSDNPLIIHISRASDAESYAYTSELYYKITNSFSPGPVTVILPKRSTVPLSVTGGLDTVALRIPSHPTARALIDAAGVAVAAPSANLSGRPSPTRVQHVVEDLYGRADMIIDGGECEIGLESTIVKLCGDEVRLLRPGAVTTEMLRQVCGDVVIDRCVTQGYSSSDRCEAPGMKYRHYAPRSPVYLIDGDREHVVRYISEKLALNPATGVLCYDRDRERIRGRNVMYIAPGHTEQAHMLFDCLRAFDKTDADVIYSVTPTADGMGLAVLNRLKKAAGFNIINVDD